MIVILILIISLKGVEVLAKALAENKKAAIVSLNLSHNSVGKNYNYCFLQPHTFRGLLLFSA